MLKTRTVEQSLVFGLVLNTFGSAESGKLVALATTAEALIDFYNREMLEEGEKIDGWFYSFKEGPLRRYNPSGTQPCSDDAFGHGIFSEYVNTDSIPTDVLRLDFA